MLTHSENTAAKVDEVKSITKFQRKKVLGLAVAVDHVKMAEHELVYNIISCHILESLLKKNGQKVRALNNKGTMVKPQH